MDIAQYLQDQDDRARWRAGHWPLYIFGLLAAAGWLWALGLAFLPVSADLRSGPLNCGSPVYFDAAIENLRDNACVPVVDQRIRSAVGVGLLTLPILGAWSATGWRLRRIASEDSLVAAVHAAQAAEHAAERERRA
ncbi:hypothetical protein [Kitasatospora sp. NBC_00458]|uniref:hypothetical protein n=1 Tax=Kitasatospora sp. NBC_00458 TaxID=2903568 RepID=UPI002E172EDC